MYPKPSKDEKSTPLIFKVPPEEPVRMRMLTPSSGRGDERGELGVIMPPPPAMMMSQNGRSQTFGMMVHENGRQGTPFGQNAPPISAHASYEPSRFIPRHTGVYCDACHANDFEGTRYKCLICPDFDVCGKCYDVAHAQHCQGGHYFVRINNPLSRALMLNSPILGNRTRNVHRVACDMCSTGGAIVGTRYQCVQCQVNICEGCELQGVHDQSHPRMKFTTGPMTFP